LYNVIVNSPLVISTFKRAWTVVAISSAALAFSYLFAGHALIDLVYKGNGPSIIQKQVMAHKSEHQLDYYRHKADTGFIRATITIVLYLLISALLLRARGLENIRLWLFFLVLGDLALLQTDLAFQPYGLFDMAREWGVPAVYEYIKEAGAAVLFFILFRKEKKSAYLVFCFLMTFMLIDDSLQYHERAGLWLREHWDFYFFAGLLHCGKVEVSELISLVPYFFGFLPALMIAYARSNKELRRTLLITMGFIAAIFLFGVVVNFASMIDFFGPISERLNTIENFGTMIFMSGLVSYVVSKVKQTGDLHK
jgi:hypothetical protein